ncbi:MAG: NapC/NirT family cytochrome c [Elusimicrobia bacterium]|nr:NapC/NirT family cytochrome c [Elusimicrobiota bacterium]
MNQGLKDRLRRLLALGGVEVAPGERWNWRLTPRFFALAAGAFVFFLVANVGLIKYSESPQFCNSCHIMEPYYKAWKHSKHAGVACIECHYPPAANVGEFRSLLYKKYQNLSQVAKYVTRTYNSKPFAVVEDASCLRSGCHSTRLLEGKIMAKTGVKFDHRPHLADKRRGRQLRCTSCHAQMVMGNHMEVTYDTCFLCHFKDMGEGRELKPLAGCVGCHEVPAKKIKIGNMTYDHREFVTKRGVSCLNCHMDIVAGKGEASKDRCFTCHNDQEKMARFDDIPFIHEQHVTVKSVACFHCHQEIRHGSTVPKDVLPPPGKPLPEAPPEGWHGPSVKFDCGICHTGKHDAPLAFYSGRAAERFGLAPMPSPMFLADVDCAACHYEASARKGDPKGSTTKASHEACVKCHGPTFQGLFEETRGELAKTLDKLDAKRGAAEKALAASALGDKERKRWGAALAKAGRDLEFLRAGRGEHNIYLAASAIAQVDSSLGAAHSATGGDGAELADLPLVSGSFCATMCHQKAGVKVPPDTVRHKGKAMPHAMHVEAAAGACRKCHELGGHKSVPLKKGVEREVCSECHAP